MRTFCFLALLILLTGCDGSSGPEAQFDPIAVKRPLNLAKQLGSDLTFADANDTFRLHLAFNAVTGHNTFTTPAADTVLVAKVSRFRGLYYFVESNSNGAYWVHAARISHRQVQGLGTGYEQMQALSKQVRNGAFSELVRFRNAANDSVRLRFDRRRLRSFYVAQLDSTSTYSLLPPTLPTAPAEASTPPKVAVRGPYPNPAQEQVTLNFAAAANHLVTLYNSQGHHLKTLTSTSSRLTFSVGDLPAGNYVIRISWPDSSAEPLARRLLVQR